MRIAKLIKEWFLCKEKNVVKSRRWAYLAMTLGVIAIISNFQREDYLISAAFFAWDILIMYVQLSTFELTRAVRNLKDIIGAEDEEI